MALGLEEPRELLKRGLMTKDGGSQALDHYFHQISRPAGSDRADVSGERHEGEAK